MKAKTLMGMIACAGACVSLSAFGNTNGDWFSASASGTDASLSGVAASGIYTVEGSKFKVDNDSESALVFTPDASITATNMSDGVVTIVATAELTPSSASDLSAVTGAKVGLAVGVDSDITNYYAYAAAGWKTLSATGVTVPDSGDTSFKIILDYRTRRAQFYIGSTLMTYDDTTPTTAPAFAAGTDSVVDIQAYGSGSITSIDADYEVAVAAYNGTKYGSVAEAVTAAKNAQATSAEVQAIGANGTPVEKTATAANGMNLVVCKALGLNTTSPSDNIAVAPVATDTAENAITLHLTTSTTGTEADLVGYEVRVNGVKNGATRDANSITIPLEAGTYTITPVLK